MSFSLVSMWATADLYVSAVAVLILFVCLHMLIFGPLPTCNLVLVYT